MPVFEVLYFDASAALKFMPFERAEAAPIDGFWY